MDETKRIFSANLINLINASGKQQIDVAREMGFSTSTINNWCKGNSFPTTGRLQIIADYFGIGKEELIRPWNKPVNNRVPVLGRVTAGIPIEAIEDIIDYEEVDDRLASIGELFGLKINGDSMSPRICDGDVVIVHKQEEAETGDTVIATINGDDAVCKRYYCYGDTVLLRSNNPAYDDINVTGRTDFHIIGKVVELRGKL